MSRRAWVAVVAAVVLAVPLAHPVVVPAAAGTGSTGIGTPDAAGSGSTGVGAPDARGDGAVTPHSGGSLHGNHVAVGTQVVGDGRVVVESAALMADGFVAIHRVADGSRGPVLGHVPLSIGTHTGVEVPVETGDLPEGENVTLRAVLYGDDGDGEFDPESDRVLRSFGGETRESFSVRVGERSVAVVVPEVRGQPSTGSVTLDRVELDRPGHVAVRADTGSGPGEVVGRTALDAGTHRNVTVEVDAEFFADREERFSLWAVVYADDGDGGFDADRPVTVGDDPVATRFPVLKVDDGNGSATVGVNTPGSTVAVNTPGGTNGTVATPATDGGTTTATAGDATTTATPGGSSGDDGLSVAVLAVTLVASAVVGFLLMRRRRR